jgi:hypothetical protein
MIPAGNTPKAEQLAAYVDGELHGAERDAVEAWLETSPLARTEVESLRHLACQCRRTAAPEPCADTWEVALGRLHAALPAEPRPLPFRRPAYRPLVPAVGVAAAVLAVLTLARSFWPVGGPVPPPPDSALPPTVATTLTGPISLADARDVEIISIDDDDTTTLLVGRPPIRDALQLAGPDDVLLMKMEPFEGFVPDLRRPRNAAPIILPRADAAESP